MGGVDEKFRGALIVRSKLAKDVRTLFALGFRDLAPQFRTTTGEVPSGTQLFVWRLREGLEFYVALQFHHMEDWFTIELAVTEKGRWPAHAGMPGRPQFTLEKGDLRFRLCRLWEPQLDPWWELAPRPGAAASLESYMTRIPLEEARAAVPEAVKAALAAVRDFGLPFFQEFRVRSDGRGI